MVAHHSNPIDTAAFARVALRLHRLGRAIFFQGAFLALAALAAVQGVAQLGYGAVSAETGQGCFMDEAVTANGTLGFCAGIVIGGLLMVTISTFSGAFVLECLMADIRERKDILGGI